MHALLFNNRNNNNNNFSQLLLVLLLGFCFYFINSTNANKQRQINCSNYDYNENEWFIGTENKNYTLIKLKDANSKLKSAAQVQEICRQCTSTAVGVNIPNDLALIENSQDLDILREKAFNLSLSLSNLDQFIYLGYFNGGGDVNWLWSLNTTSNFSNWSNMAILNDTLRKCSVMNLTSGLWSETMCCLNEMDVKIAACSKLTVDREKVTIEQEIQSINFNETCYSGCSGDSGDASIDIEYFKHANICYSLIKRKNNSTIESVYEARKECQKYEEAADLPSVSNSKQLEFIKQVIRQQESFPKIYIGLAAPFNETGSDSNEFYFSFFNNNNNNNKNGNFSTNVNDSNYFIANDFRDGDDVNKCIVMKKNNDGVWIFNKTYCCLPPPSGWNYAPYNLTSKDLTNFNLELTSNYIVCQRPVNGNVTVKEEEDIVAKHCFANYDECLSNPCQNIGSTCENHLTSYECNCGPGWTGVNCEIEINYCISNPCQNGGTCHNNKTIPGWSCDCLPAFTGTNCSRIVDQCYSNPCQNQATCVDGNERYDCVCVSGYEGVNCETNIDDCANVTCQNGATCQDKLNDYKCICPLNYYGQFCQHLVICPNPTPIIYNSTLNVTGYGYLDKATYTCNNHTLFPDRTVKKEFVCDLNNKWSGYTSDLICERHCPSIPIVKNSIQSTNLTSEGTFINYTCLHGYYFKDDNSTSMNITCLKDDVAKWSLDVTKIKHCEIITCPKLPYHPHQHLETRNNTFGTTVVFWCDIGYVLHDNTTARTIKCLESGQWSAELPPCLSVYCNDLGEIKNGRRNTTNVIYDTYVLYECLKDETDETNHNKKDLRMLDGAIYKILKCDASWEWSDMVTDCDKDRCYPLPFVANATPSDLNATFTHTVKLTCDLGHSFSDSSIISTRETTCKTTGKWRPILPPCKPVLCNEPMNVKNALADTKNRIYGTILNYQCIKGHYFDTFSYHNSIPISCQADKSWNGSLNSNLLIGCQPIKCPPPFDIYNGTGPTDNNQRIYADQIVYDCNSGFKFIDGSHHKVLECDEFGNWNESDLSCRKDRCDPIFNIANTFTDTRNTSWYTNVTYRCMDGYEWPSNKMYHMIYCHNDGKWKHKTAEPLDECKPKVCPTIYKMPNATLQGVDTIFDSSINYTCFTGFKFHNNDTVKTQRCNEDGKWSPNIDSCQIRHCPQLPSIENATKSSNDTHYNVNVYYNCLDGYQLPDKSKSFLVTCLLNETWTVLPPPCEVVFCPPVPKWGDMKFNSTENEFLSVVSYECDEKFGFPDRQTNPQLKRTSICQPTKQWSPPIEECVELESIAADLIGVSYESPQAVSIGTIAVIILSVFFGAVILLDLNKIYMDLKIMKENFKSMLNPRGNKVHDSSVSLGTADAP